MSLSRQEWERLEEDSWAVIQECKISSPPIAIADVAKKQGLSVISYDLGDNVSGTLVIENGNGFIGYNPTHSKVRQRFTIAHELAHYILHCKNQKSEQLFVDKDFIVKYRSENSYTPKELRQEQQANVFAAAVLMPKKFIDSELAKRNFKEMGESELIESLAKLFEVSIPAMTYRLNDLNTFYQAK
jgi:Zn-dependent peptidase ImmA (M78 family)